MDVLQFKTYLMKQINYSQGYISRKADILLIFAAIKLSGGAASAETRQGPCCDLHRSPPWLDLVEGQGSCHTPDLCLWPLFREIFFKEFHEGAVRRDIYIYNITKGLN